MKPRYNYIFLNFIITIFIITNQVIAKNVLQESKNCFLEQCNILRNKLQPIVGRLLDNNIIKIKPYGYIKYEYYVDTRQILSYGETQELIAPAPIRLDKCGRDINAHPEFNMFACESSFGINITGPKCKCFKTLGVIESDFRGLRETDIGVFHLKYAWGKIESPNSSLLYGRYVHPLTLLECTPQTISFNTGEPFEPYSRVAQLRLSYKFNCLETTLTFASEQIETASNGPLGFQVKYMRDSKLPNINLQFKYYFNKKSFIGIDGDYKRLVPRLVTNKNFKVNEYIDSFIFQSFLVIYVLPVSIRAKIVYAQNGTDLLLMSGYAVRTIDPVTDYRTYTNITAVSGWLDTSYIFGFNNIELGLFLGAGKNLGAGDKVFINRCDNKAIVYTLFKEFKFLDYQFRVSPRFVIARDPVRMGLELEYSQAAYGCYDKYLRVHDACPVANLRLLFALYYVF